MPLRKHNPDRLAMPLGGDSPHRFIDNRVPRYDGPWRVAIIGDLPQGTSPDETALAGGVGRTLFALLRELGYSFAETFQGNVCQYVAPSGRFTTFGWQSREAQDSIERLLAQLNDWRPNVILAMGPVAVTFFKGTEAKLGKERGAPFFTDKLDYRTLVVPTYHLKDVFKVYQWMPLFQLDLEKACKYGQAGSYRYTEPKVVTTPTLVDAKQHLDYWLANKTPLNVDIETSTHPDTHIMTCIGLCPEPGYAFVIPFVTGRDSYWSRNEEVMLWPLLAKVLERCPLTGHNAVSFDHAILARHGIDANFVEDTMLIQWELWPELPKALDFVASIYTDNPYWKDMRGKVMSGESPLQRLWHYNGLDVANGVEIEIAEREELLAMPEPVQRHYRFNIRVARCLQRAQLEGVLVDRDKHQERLTTLGAECARLQEQLNAQVGTHINTSSPPQMKRLLYDQLGLPVKFKRVRDQFGDEEQRETTEIAALLHLAFEHPDIEALRTVIDLKKATKRVSNLGFVPDKSSRIYASYNVVGTETGRVACYKGHDVCGVAMHTVFRGIKDDTVGDRDLFLPDPGHVWLKADLEGADSWTVAAGAAAHGDPTMLDDLRAGLKPAKALAVMFAYGEQANNWSRDEIKAAAKKVTQIDYDIAKRCTHGSCYDMQEWTMAETIFKFSLGEVYVTPNECGVRRKLFFKRYPGVLLWQKATGQLLRRQGHLDSSAGTRRVFLGRVDSKETYKEALAHLPQAHTTYATNYVLATMMSDPANWPNGRRQAPITSPRNQLHDEGDWQARSDSLDDVAKLFWRVANFSMSIFGYDIVIPFEAQHGPSWGEAKTDLPNPYEQ